MTAIFQNGTDPTRVVGRRIVAYLIDAVIAYAVLGGILFLLFDVGVETTTDQYGYQQSELVMSSAAWAAFFMLLFTYYVVVQVILEGYWGWTLGKLIMQLRVAGWDGRPPGPVKALIRNLCWVVDGICGGVVALLSAVLTKGHRRIGDMAANTYVIDSVYAGRLIIRTNDNVVAGPESVTAEEWEAAKAAPGGSSWTAGTPTGPPAGPARSGTGPTSAPVDDHFARQRPSEPVFDPGRGAYVVWNAEEQRLYLHDAATGGWRPA